MSREDEAQARYWAVQHLIKDYKGGKLTSKVRYFGGKVFAGEVTIHQSKLEKLIKQAIERI